MPNCLRTHSPGGVGSRAAAGFDNNTGMAFTHAPLRRRTLARSTSRKICPYAPSPISFCPRPPGRPAVPSPNSVLRPTVISYTRLRTGSFNTS
eukprot:5520212-Pyramimonas_sp.AAC.3